MKRSKRVVLALMGATGALSGCAPEPQEQAITFKDLDECKSSGKFAPEVCDSAYKSAEKAAQDELKYKSRSDCASDFGHDRCQVVVRNDGTSVFVPMMAGFMVSQALNSASNIDDIAEAEYYREKTRQLKRDEERKNAIAPVSSRALYTSRDDSRTFRTATNKTVGSVTSTGKSMRVSKSVVTAKPRTASFSRGGFGSSASRGGWGG